VINDYVYMQGMNTINKRIKVFRSMKADFFTAVVYDFDNKEIDLHEFENEKDVNEFLLENEYKIPCKNCGNPMNYGEAEIHAVRFLNGDISEFCEDCWSEYTTDIKERETINVVLEGKLLKDRIKEILENDNLNNEEELKELIK